MTKIVLGFRIHICDLGGVNDNVCMHIYTRLTVYLHQVAQSIIGLC